MPSGDIPSILELAKMENVANIIYIIGTLVAIASANKTQQIEIEKQSIAQTSPAESTVPTPTESTRPTPAQLVVNSGWFFIAGNIIFGTLAYIRLRQVQRNIESGTSTTNLQSNILITFGWMLSILGSLLRQIGFIQKAQITEITII